VICTKIADSTVDSKEVVVIKLSYIYEQSYSLLIMTSTII